jgi:hypothetical protein
MTDVRDQTTSNLRHLISETEAPAIPPPGPVITATVASATFRKPRAQDDFTKKIVFYERAASPQERRVLLKARDNAGGALGKVCKLAPAFSHQ